MLNQNEITQQIFDSISIIVENRLAGLNYDKTIICTVVDNSNAKNNIYTVTDGNIKFEANGQGNKYNINDSVRVEILNGDWKQTKYIQGKHSSEDDLKPVTYVSPIDSILKLTDNLIENFPTDLARRSLRANQGPDLNKPTELKLCTINISDDVKNADIFNSIYLQADFQTDLDQYQIRSGDYGLLLVLNNADGSTTQALKFSATEHMFGNPYAFKIYTTQAKTYELSATNWSEGISSITVYLYEDNNFTYYNDATQTVEAFPEAGIDNIKINNIKIQNLVLGFGSQIYNIKDNEIKIYTDNTDTFTVAGENPEDPEIKNLKLLWYNKTEDNKYIGFSDGKASDFTDKDNNTQTYLQYDEIKYRDLVKEDNRLLAQKSDDYYDDKLSLSIAADRIDIDKLVQSSAKIIQGELYRELRGLYKWTKNMFKADESDTVIDDMLKIDEDADINISLSKLAVSLVENSKSLSAYYLEALKAAKDKRIIDNQIDNIHNGVLVPIQTVFTLFGYDYSSNELVLKAATDDNQDVFPTLKKLIEEKYVSYEDIYTSYKTRIDLLLKDKIFNNYKEINKLLGIGDDNGNAAQLKTLITGKYNYKAEDAYVNSSDNEEYNNRYCIYWYRENLTHTDPDGILPTGWEKIDSQNNKGLPSEDTSNPGYLQARAGAAACKITFNRYIQKEKIKAVLFYNHEQFESNILEFSNTANVVDTSAIDKNGALYIEHYNSIDGKQSHSKDSYQLYDANGLLINAAETQYKRELRVRFDGETGKDEQLIGATVYWYVPKNATLLDVFDSEIQDFHTDRVKEYSSLTAFKNACKRDLISNHASYLVQVNKHEDDGESSPENAEWRVYVVSTTFNEYDKSYLALNQLRGDINTDKTKIYLVQDSSNPLVYKKYKYNETVDEWEEDTSGTDVERFTMTTYGETKPNDIEAQLANSRMYKPGYNCYFKTIGEKVKAELEDADEVKVADTVFTYHIKDYYNQTFTQNTIYCQVVKDETNYYADKTFAFSSFGNSGTDYTLTLLPDLEQNVITIDHPLDINMTLYDYNNHKIDIPLTQENPFSWKGPSGYGEPTSLRTDSNNIIGVKIAVSNPENHDCYAGILECTIKNIEIEQLNNKKVNLTSYLPIPYSENLNSYIEGTTTIIYDSLGTNPYYYKTPYKLFNALQNIEISDVIWSIEYYCNEEKTWTYYNGEAEQTISFTKFTINEDGNAIVGELVLLPEALTNDDGNAERIAKQQKLLQELSLNYLLKLNTIDNTVIPCVMYIDNLNIYPVVIAKKDNNILWAQPILIIKNRYASPMLNAWDGSLEINEEKNTIMSMMMGAGRKNNNNQFEGVLMGDVRTGTGDDATAIGLYGFHEGAQSFGFKIDGTAFLGKAGHGRIYMDGNNGFIASGNWLTTGGTFNSDDGSLGGSATEGMAISLKDGHIDAYNFKLTTGNFVLSSGGIAPPSSSTDPLTSWYETNEEVGQPNKKGTIIFNANNKFAVTENGHLFAQNGYFTGIIHALDGGTIGGWNIGSDYIYAEKESVNIVGLYSGNNSDTMKRPSLVDETQLSYVRFYSGPYLEEKEYVKSVMLNKYNNWRNVIIASKLTNCEIELISRPNVIVIHKATAAEITFTGEQKSGYWVYTGHLPIELPNDAKVELNEEEIYEKNGWSFEYLGNGIMELKRKTSQSFVQSLSIKIDYNYTEIITPTVTIEDNKIIYSINKPINNGIDYKSTIKYKVKILRYCYEVCEDGSIYANSAHLSGYVDIANGGKIGDWIIGPPHYSQDRDKYGTAIFYRPIQETENGNLQYGMSCGMACPNKNDTDIIFWAGCKAGTPWETSDLLAGQEQQNEDIPFIVRANGEVICSNLQIKSGILDTLTLYNNNESNKYVEILANDNGGIISVGANSVLKLMTDNNRSSITLKSTAATNIQEQVVVGITVYHVVGGLLNYHTYQLDATYQKADGTKINAPIDFNISITYRSTVGGVDNVKRTHILTLKQGKNYVGQLLATNIEAPWSFDEHAIYFSCNGKETKKIVPSTDVGGANGLNDVGRWTIDTGIGYTNTCGDIEIYGNLIPSLERDAATGMPQQNLGDANHPWYAFFEQANIDTASITVESNSGSDIRIKNSISTLPANYELFFDKMEPVRYKYNEGTSNRFHTGFIAQQLVSALKESDLTTQDFAGVMLHKPDTDKECWYLRRDEFVALNTWQIQKLKPRMTEAEERIYNLEQEIKELKAQLL